jgi:hypothetical protein
VGEGRAALGSWRLSVGCLPGSGVTATGIGLSGSVGGGWWSRGRRVALGAGCGLRRRVSRVLVVASGVVGLIWGMTMWTVRGITALSIRVVIGLLGRGRGGVVGVFCGVLILGSGCES